MKVIFIKDLKNQGKKDDIKEVKDGFAQYLIKEGYAVKYTPNSHLILENEILVRNQQEEELIKECNSIKKAIEKLTLKFKVKTGVNDKVFGSISSKQIEEELKLNGFNIDKKKIKIENDINSLGIHNVKVNLHKKVEATLKIELIN